jgi:uncharacterized repeat protein (TIGR03803 family)
MRTEPLALAGLARMRTKLPRMIRHAVSAMFAAAFFAAVSLSAAPARAAVSVTPLHSFAGAVGSNCGSAILLLDGVFPTGNLSLGPDGAFYGTTETGGTCGGGIVFRLSTSGSAPKYSIVYNFTGQADGASPLGGVIFDANGNAYGTTGSGGAQGHGTVFRLTPTASGPWTLQTLYAFAGGTDGATPFGALLMDKSGALYGTTSIGGHSHIGCLPGCGTIFRLRPVAHGAWKERVLHRFLDAFGEGAEPRTGLIADATGNLYGTTYYGGDDTGCSGMGCGTVFALRPLKGDHWKLNSFHHFEVTDGAFPRGPVTLDGQGNLYGTAMEGGAFNDGTIFRFNNASGKWRMGETFSFGGDDGREPTGPLTITPGGTIYGTTYSGGAQFWGTVFSIVPGGSSWQETPLYSFTDATDGADPLDAGVLFDASGNGYTMGNQGGVQGGCAGAGCGAIVEVTGLGAVRLRR